MSEKEPSASQKGKMLKLLTWKDVFKECYLDKSKDKKLYVAVEGLVAELNLLPKSFTKKKEILDKFANKIADKNEAAMLSGSGNLTIRSEEIEWLVEETIIQTIEKILGLLGCSEKQQKREGETELMKHLSFKHVGRSPSGGLAGGDDVYICRRCYMVTDSPREDQDKECSGIPTEKGTWGYDNMLLYRKEHPNWKKELEELEEREK